MSATETAFFQTANAMTWTHGNGAKLKPAAYPSLSMDILLNVERDQELG